MLSPTCDLLHGLQADVDGLVSQQGGGWQRAGHALHDADVLHALGHGQGGHAVVSVEGTVTVYTATCRRGGRLHHENTGQADYIYIYSLGI